MTKKQLIAMLIRLWDNYESLKLLNEIELALRYFEKTVWTCYR